MFCASVLAILWKAAVMMLMLTGARTVMATDYLAEILVLTGAVALPPVGAVAPLSCCCSAAVLGAASRTVRWRSDTGVTGSALRSRVERLSEGEEQWRTVCT